MLRFWEKKDVYFCWMSRNLTLSLLAFSSFTVFHDSPSLLYATLKTVTNCTTPKSLAPWVMMPLMRFVFSRSTWATGKGSNKILFKIHDILVPGSDSLGSTRSGYCARGTKRWSSRVCPDGQTEGATWSCQCPTCGKSWRLKSVRLRWAGTSFPEALSNLPCLNKLWILSRRREGEAKQEKEEEWG